MKKQAKVLICRVGRRPIVRLLDAHEDDFLDAMQTIVGGNVECVMMDDGVDLWCNEDGIGLGLPLNRVIAADPRQPNPFDGFVIYAGDDLARPGEPGEWRILGDFFLARSHKGEVADIDESSAQKYIALFDSEDIAMAKRMNDLRTARAQVVAADEICR